MIAAEMSSTAATAAAMGIPERTVGYWMDSPEFADLRTKTRADMSHESAVLAHRTLEVIKDKLDQFEPRDLTILYGVLVDKAQLLSGEATSRTETRDLTTAFDDDEWAKLKDVLREAVDAGV